MRRFILSLALLLSTCGGGTPMLERAEGDDWTEVESLELVSIEGERRGAEVSLTAVLRGGLEEEIILDIELVLDPPARFVGGRHRGRIGGHDTEGGLTSESVAFLGGQNTAGSVGGVFVFRSTGEDVRYRVRFPATIMEPR